MLKIMNDLADLGADVKQLEGISDVDLFKFVATKIVKSLPPSLELDLIQDALDCL